MHRLRLVVAGAFVASIALAQPCVAADGDLDPSFADGGRLVLTPSDASLWGARSSPTRTVR